MTFVSYKVVQCILIKNVSRTLGPELVLLRVTKHYDSLTVG
jgi:hypothetical protein